MKLYYNCDRPLEILDSNRIKVSTITKGVSMSEQFNLASHGPFKLEFTDPIWMPLMLQCLYMTPIQEEPAPGKILHKTIGYRDQLGKAYSIQEAKDLSNALHRVVKLNDYFADEEEWWSYSEIYFLQRELTGIYFMHNAPNLYPRITALARKELAEKYPDLYKEVQVDDAYFRKEKYEG